MRIKIVVILTLIVALTLVACGNNEIQEDANGQDYFNGEVLEVHDNYVQVECLDVTTGAIASGTQLRVTKDVLSANEVPEMNIGDEIRVVFTGVLETDPPRLQTVDTIYLLGDDGNTITGNSAGEYLELPDIEDEGFPNWGITLSVKNVTPTGLTLVCTQSGGEPTGELQTGSDYKLITLKDGTWSDVPTIIENYGWTSEAYMIALGESRNFDITWEWLYGALPAGTYRLTKGFMDFRGTGDYDTAEYWTEFVIEE